MNRFIKTFTKIKLFTLILFTSLLISNSVYSQNTDVYQLQATFDLDLPSNEPDSFGFSVDVDGDTAIVGAPAIDTGNNGSQGATYIYVRSGSTWELQQMLTASDSQQQDKFGYAVAIEGDTAFVGRHNTRVGAGRSDGRVFVFKRTGTAWTETQILQSNDVAVGDLFGSALAVENGTLIAGASGKGFFGAAYIFTQDGSGNFVQQAKLSDPSSTFNDKFGISVDISGETVVIGASGQPGLGAEEGRGFAYIFTRNGSSWMQEQKLIASDRAASDVFGIDVAVSGDTAAISAKFDDNFRGSVYIFTRSGGTWTEQTKIVNPNTSSQSAFGTAISLDGQTLAITGGFDNIQSSRIAATVVYTGSGANWNELDLLETSGAGSVDVDGNSIISGAPTGNATDGKAYVHASVINPTISANFNFDFDGDGKADQSLFRPTDTTWYINSSSANFAPQSFYGVQFGLSSDQLTPADFDGDGKTDIAVWREATQSRFYILQSSDGTVREESFGVAGDDPKVVGDWDGDGKADPAVYRAGNPGTFYYRGSLDNPNGNITFIHWGFDDDKAVRGDFDGDGKLDLCVFRPSNATWYIRQSSDGTFHFRGWGISSDKLVPADYDGDAKTDLAVFRNGVWYILQSSSNQARFETFGLSSDQLAPADYDGDGKADVTVYRDGLWYVLESTSRNAVITNFGSPPDKAVPNSFVK